VTYLQLLRESYLIPNFWCADAYWRHAGWEETQESVCAIQALKVINQETREPMLPTLLGGPASRRVAMFGPYWASFFSSNLCPSDKFLDYNFLYSPARFLDLSGGEWTMTRKNLRWCEQDLGEMAELEVLTQDRQDVLWQFLDQWGAEHEGEQFYEADVMLRYLAALEGESVLALIGKQSRLPKAILLWDENWWAINFRYCLTLKGVRGLSDYARVAFYRWLNHRTGEIKFVNDGGSLDRPSLFDYKMRLNPIGLYPIYSGGGE